MIRLYFRLELFKAFEITSNYMNKSTCYHFIAVVTAVDAAVELVVVVVVLLSALHYFSLTLQ